MTERRQDFLYLLALLALLVLFFSRMLFTDMIIRAPDIINEFYWTVRHFKMMNFWELFQVHLHPSWDILTNSGTTEGGGALSMQFLFHRNLIFYLFPEPTNIAWYIVLNLFFGATGVYFLCRSIGTGRTAAFLGGLIFVLAPENASLINAGHVQKIATICVAPWAFLVFEKGFQSRRLIYFLATAVILAFQFFTVHWQIAFYTCLGIGAYGLLRTLGILFAEGRTGGKGIARLFGLNLVTVLFFLSTVAISLVPLADWSKDTNRGVQSGANAGKGGLVFDEAMSWSFPPEEVASFVVPGLFGLSRQEGGYPATDIRSYYWGRMRFTQTTDYMGLLPWLLLPLPLIFRRDRYTWLALAGVAGGILFSMGKYTLFYRLLYEYFPGINHFRVPKMMMFLPVLGLALLAARGLDLLLDGQTVKTRTFRRYLYGVAALPVLLALCLGILVGGEGSWKGLFHDILAQPNRFEEGTQLVLQRWDNLLRETGIAIVLATVCAAALFATARKWLPVRLAPLLFLLLFLGDVWRVNDSFLFLTSAPTRVTAAKTPVMEFLARETKQYRVLPANGADPMSYIAQGIPVMFTSNAVQQQRWQEILDAFSFTSAIPDMLNVKYLVYATGQYEQDKAQFGDHYVPVFRSPDGGELVLENRKVMPKAWLVPAVALITDPREMLAILQNPRYDPRQAALVETTPLLPMANPSDPPAGPIGTVSVTRYEGERISVTARPLRNALLVLGEKYARGWQATVNGVRAEIVPVNHILRGIYLPPGEQQLEFVFAPRPFMVGKYLTIGSFALFALFLGREFWVRRKGSGENAHGSGS